MKENLSISLLKLVFKVLKRKVLPQGNWRPGRNMKRIHLCKKTAIYQKICALKINGYS